MSTERDTPTPASIQDLIERSSLGTPEAKALRATVSDERVAAVTARVKADTERDTLAQALWSADAAYRTDEDGTVDDVPFECAHDRDLYVLQADRLMPWLAQVRAEARSSALTEAAEAVSARYDAGCSISGQGDAGYSEGFLDGLDLAETVIRGLTGGEG